MGPFHDEVLGQAGLGVGCSEMPKCWRLAALLWGLPQCRQDGERERRRERIFGVVLAVCVCVYREMEIPAT